MTRRQLATHLRRDVLSVLASFRGDGPATAQDIVKRLHGHDGRRVAGALQGLRARGHVTSSTRSDDVVEWHLEPAGLRYLADAISNEPRLVPDGHDPSRLRARATRLEAAPRPEARSSEPAPRPPRARTTKLEVEPEPTLHPDQLTLVT